MSEDKKKPSSWGQVAPTEEELEAVKFNAQRQAALDSVQLGILQALQVIVQEMKRSNEFLATGKMPPAVNIEFVTTPFLIDETQPPEPDIPYSPLSPRVEEVIITIMKVKPQLPRETILRLIDEERARAAGLLTEEAAAYLVGSNLGVFEKQEEPEQAAIQGPVPENLDTDESIIAYYKNFIAGVTLNDGSPMLQKIVDGLEIRVEEDRVTMRTGWITDKRYWAAIADAVKTRLGGEWIKDDKNSHFLLPKP